MKRKRTKAMRKSGAADTMSNTERIRSTIASGLAGHRRQREIAKFHEAAKSLVKSFEQATKLKIEAAGVHVVGVDLRLASKDPQDNVSVAYKRRHTGLFPFPHDHCTFELCWESTIEGETVEICVEIEYPCNVDWPIIGRL
jgi:hypothetical protein